MRCHHLTDARQFLDSGLAGILQRMYFHRMSGHWWSVGPDVIQWVHLCEERIISVSAEGFLKSLDK